VVPLKSLAARRGRPPKFGRPARTVTLTLPEDLIASLTAVDPDLSRATVRLLEPVAHDVVPRPSAELSRFRDSAVIIVRPIKALAAIPGTTLVPLVDGRALISLDPTMTVADFELLLRDAIDDGRVDERERSVLVTIGEILRSARQSKKIVVRQRSIIVLQSTSRRPVGET
jgi:hypothetical protein